jgi:hypothetical protein
MARGVSVRGSDPRREEYVKLGLEETLEGLRMRIGPYRPIAMAQSRGTGRRMSWQAKKLESRRVKPMEFVRIS